jgi:membrane protein implicated in regulation of membrane protease activity
MTLFTLAMGVMAAVMAIRAHRRHPVSGEEGLVGTEVTLDAPLSPVGHIWLEGESWHARAHAPVPAGTRVRVVAFEGLTALVEPVAPAAPGARDNPRDPAPDRDKENAHG